jgi:hypothetical protein
LNALHQLTDCFGLISCGLIWGLKLKGHNRTKVMLFGVGIRLVILD